MADMEKTGKNLEGRGFRVHRFATGAEAAEFLVQTLHGTSIGIGGSVTIDTLGVYDRLCGSNEVFWHWKNHAPETRERAGKAKTYLCSANGVSENGEIVKSTASATAWPVRSTGRSACFSSSAEIRSPRI